MSTYVKIESGTGISWNKNSIEVAWCGCIRWVQVIKEKTQRKKHLHCETCDTQGLKDKHTELEEENKEKQKKVERAVTPEKETYHSKILEPTI